MRKQDQKERKSKKKQEGRNENGKKVGKDN